MKRPSFLTYVASNPIILFGLWGLTLWQGYAAIRGEVSFLVPFFLACFAGGSMRASDQVEKFNRWNSEWKMMQGIMPFRIRIPGLRMIVGGSLWLGAAYYIIRHGDEPDAAWASPLFWLATAILAGRGLYHFVKRRSGARPRRAKNVPVTLCLPTAHRSASLQEAYAALPDYCLALFAPQDHAGHATRRNG